MKRLLFIVAMVLSALTAGAQEIMQEYQMPGDPLLDMQDAYVLHSDHVTVAVIDGGECHVVISISDHIFTDKSFRVGFYDNDGNLLYMCDKWECRVEEDGHRAFLVDYGFCKTNIPGSMDVGNDRYMLPRKAILEYLLKRDGYVRFVTTEFGEHLYDISVRLPKQ